MRKWPIVAVLLVGVLSSGCARLVLDGSQRFEEIARWQVDSPEAQPADSDSCFALYASEAGDALLVRSYWFTHLYHIDKGIYVEAAVSPTIDAHGRRGECRATERLVRGRHDFRVIGDVGVILGLQRRDADGAPNPDLNAVMLLIGAHPDYRRGDPRVGHRHIYARDTGAYTTVPRYGTYPAALVRNMKSIPDATIAHAQEKATRDYDQEARY